MGCGEGLGAEKILPPAPIPTDSADPGPDILLHSPTQRILFKELGWCLVILEDKPGYELLKLVWATGSKDLTPCTLWFFSTRIRS